MARIRTVKPEFWTSEQVAECSPTARLLFIGLWNFCDDAGRHPDSAMRIKMEVFPADAMTADDVELLLGELLDACLIERYETEGKGFIQVTGWHHQRIDKPQFRYPSPNGIGTVDDQPTNGPPRNRKGREGNLRSTVEGDQMRELTEAEIGTVRKRANEVSKRVGKPEKPQDRSLVLKCSMLTLRAPYTEAWLYGAAEGTAKSSEKKRTPYAYLTDCLKEGAEKLGRVLMADLKKITIPEVLTKPPPNADDLSERICKPETP